MLRPSGIQKIRIAILEDLLFECASFDSTAESPGKSVRWTGVLLPAAKDNAPDVIYARGGKGKEGIIYLTGEDPVVVANNIIICSNRI